MIQPPRPQRVMLQQLFPAKQAATLHMDCASQEPTSAMDHVTQPARFFLGAIPPIVTQSVAGISVMMSRTPASKIAMQLLPGQEASV